MTVILTSCRALSGLSRKGISTARLALDTRMAQAEPVCLTRLSANGNIRDERAQADPSAIVGNSKP